MIKKPRNVTPDCSKRRYFTNERTTKAIADKMEDTDA